MFDWRKGPRAFAAGPPTGDIGPAAKGCDLCPLRSRQVGASEWAVAAAFSGPSRCYIRTGVVISAPRSIRLSAALAALLAACAGCSRQAAHATPAAGAEKVLNVYNWSDYPAVGDCRFPERIWHPRQLRRVRLERDPR